MISNFARVKGTYVGGFFSAHLTLLGRGFSTMCNCQYLTLHLLVSMFICVVHVVVIEKSVREVFCDQLMPIHSEKYSPNHIDS